MSTPGTTDLEFVETGFVSVRFHGKLDAAETGLVLDFIEKHVGEEPFFLMEADMTDIDGATPEARRVAAERLRKLPDRAIAVVGGGFAQKMIAKLVLTAVSMLSARDRNVAEFFKDSEGARAWLRQYRSDRVSTTT